MQPSPIPHGRTARRLEWPHLPPTVRAAIEERCGAAVRSATTQNGGFTPGFASVLECEDDSRHFVKAASAVAQRMFAEAYREEARKLEALPTAAPAARLLWSSRRRRLVRALDRVRRGAAAAPALAAAGAPALPGHAGRRGAGPDPAARRAGDCHPRRRSSPSGRRTGTTCAPPALTSRTSRKRRPWPGAFVEVMAGETLVHTDVRDDNILLTADGRALLCDWNWPMVGAAWLDSLFLLIGPRGDGLDVAAVIDGHPLLSAVPDGGHRRRPGAGDGLLPQECRGAGPAELAVPPRRPALAGRGVLGLAERTPRLELTASGFEALSAPLLPLSVALAAHPPRPRHTYPSHRIEPRVHLWPTSSPRSSGTSRTRSARAQQGRQDRPEDRRAQVP